VGKKICCFFFLTCNSVDSWKSLWTLLSSIQEFLRVYKTRYLSKLTKHVVFFQCAKFQNHRSLLSYFRKLPKMLIDKMYWEKVAVLINLFGGKFHAGLAIIRKFTQVAQNQSIHFRPLTYHFGAARYNGTIFCSTGQQQHPLENQCYNAVCNGSPRMDCMNVTFISIIIIWAEFHLNMHV